MTATSGFTWTHGRKDHGYSTSLHLQLALHVRATLHIDGRTQAWLAAETGLTEKHVSMVLSGLSDGSFDIWERFAAALGEEWVVDLAAPSPVQGSGE